MVLSHFTHPHTLGKATHERVAEHMNRALLVLNAVERLPILSTGILEDVDHGESYENIGAATSRAA